MKKLISIAVVLLVVIQAYLSAVTVSNQEVNTLAGLERRHCISFTIPDDVSICVPEVLFSALQETSQALHVNIIRSRFRDSTYGRYVVEKYILLNSESYYCNEFNLSAGRFLTAQESNSQEYHFLSTSPVEGDRQVGTIRSHMLKIDVVVYPLFQEFYSFQASGLYYAELPETVSEEVFLQTLKQNLEMASDSSIHIADLTGSDTIVRIPTMSTFLYDLIFYTLSVLIFVFLLYYYFSRSKQISIMKLHGIPVNVITWKMQRSFHVVYWGAAVIIFSVILVPIRDLSYCIQILVDIARLYVVLFSTLFAIGWIYTKNGKIQSLLKGHTETNGILILNTAVKCVCILICLYIGHSLVYYTSNIIYNKKIFREWEQSSSYGVFYPLYIGNELTAEERDKTEVAINQNLYPILNSDGALFIDARDFDNENEAGFDHFQGYRSITVNPNYLNLFPLYDEEGTKITVSEEEKNWILLLPQKYRAEREKIISYFQSVRSAHKEIDETYYHLETDESVNQQQIKVIWLADNQTIFCMNPRVGENGCLRNVIIEVVTTSNRYSSDTECVLGSGSSDPLKIRLSGSSNETYGDIQPILANLGLDDNLKYIVSVNDSILEHIAELNILLRKSVILAFLVLSTVIFISIQSISILFNKNKKAYLVKKLFGCSRLQVYRYPCYMSILCCTVSSIIFPVFAVFIGAKTSTQFVLVAWATILLVDMLTLAVYTTTLEKRTISDTLKGA